MNDRELNPVSCALAALSGSRYEIAVALAHVPAAPGPYAVFGTRGVWSELGIVDETGQGCLYVGKAEDSLVSRDLRTHFATGRTASSTVRRSFAALLGDSLGPSAIPRNPSKPERFANFGLAPPDDERLTEWMQERLSLAFWIKPAGFVLDAVETEVIRAWFPPLNIAKNPRPLARLKVARRAMAAEARSWTKT